jgi:hypothetical protein
MAEPPLFAIPPELRLEIYKYLVPTQVDDGTADSVRVVCRLIQSEFDHEVIEDIAKYYKLFSKIPGAIIKIQPAKTYEETKQFRMSLELTKNFRTVSEGEPITESQTMFEGEQFKKMLHSIAHHVSSVIINIVEPADWATNDSARTIFRADAGRIYKLIDGLCYQAVPLDSHFPAFKLYWEPEEPEKEKLLGFITTAVWKYHGLSSRNPRYERCVPRAIYPDGGT